MPTEIHFIDVGYGNMTLLKLSDGSSFLYDCNVTNENEKDVLGYLGKQLSGSCPHIDVFICSHRDADHMRGIKKVHENFPVRAVWDSGVTGTTPDSPEYLEYMNVRRTVGYREVKRGDKFEHGNTILKVLNSKNDELPGNANSQSIVIKIVHLSKNVICSCLLPGDTNAVTWKNIGRYYPNTSLSCDILLASHHGSTTYFDDPSDNEHYYTDHIKAKSPDMTIISVGSNAHGHPDKKAVEFYEKYSRGSDKGNKILTTDKNGNIRLVLKDGGGWETTHTKI
jgi:beta-lactamase superfamily II metal-dependent hydrolase